ncbi:hypothetical protein BGX20_005282, partial [Mortierella sp. AD010]
MASEVTLFCIVDGDSTAFSVDILPGKTVDHLKKKIKEEKSKVFSEVDPDELILWHVSIPIGDDNEEEDDKPILLKDYQDDAKKIRAKQAATEICKIFGAAPLKNTIH